MKISIDAHAGLFDSNTAHSSAIGLRMYAEGYHPADDAVFTNFVTYKSNQMGMSFHESRSGLVPRNPSDWTHLIGPNN